MDPATPAWDVSERRETMETQRWQTAENWIISIFLELGTPELDTVLQQQLQRCQIQRQELWIYVCGILRKRNRMSFIPFWGSVQLCPPPLAIMARVGMIYAQNLQIFQDQYDTRPNHMEVLYASALAIRLLGLPV
ncbi:unnamed protein product [Lepidochelys kempii]